ncbi:hypothetical protein PG995_012531 [Apiospora arundinis]
MVVAPPHLSPAPSVIVVGWKPAAKVTVVAGAKKMYPPCPNVTFEDCGAPLGRGAPPIVTVAGGGPPSSPHTLKVVGGPPPGMDGNEFQDYQDQDFQDHQDQDYQDQRLLTKAWLLARLPKMSA